MLTVGSADQAAVRAVMTMLWDSGHVVLAMATRSRRSRTGPNRELR